MLLSNYIFSGISPLTTIKRKDEINLRWLMFLSVTAKYYICGEIREEGSWPQVCHPPRIRVNIHVLMTTLPVPTWAHLTGPSFYLSSSLWSFYFLTVTHEWIPPLLEKSFVWHVPLNIIRLRISGVSLQVFHDFTVQGSHFFGLTKFHDISMIFPGF